MLSHQVPAGGFWSFGTKVRVAPMPHAGVKSRVTCVCSAAVSARHSSSLTTVLALMTETAISGIDILRMAVVRPIGRSGSLEQFQGDWYVAGLMGFASLNPSYQLAPQ